MRRGFVCSKVLTVSIVAVTSLQTLFFRPTHQPRFAGHGSCANAELLHPVRLLEGVRPADVLRSVTTSLLFHSFQATVQNLSQPSLALHYACLAWRRSCRHL